MTCSLPYVSEYLKGCDVSKYGEGCEICVKQNNHYLLIGIGICIIISIGLLFFINWYVQKHKLNKINKNEL